MDRDANRREDEADPSRKPGSSAGHRLDELRREYAGQPLDESAAGTDPHALFDHWLDQAVASGIELANAMTLATVGPDGRPAARMVLLKGADRRGLVFYSSYDGRKAAELRHQPAAALLFYWAELHRQIRVEGRVEQISAAESDAYFASRPRASNLSAMASAQSRPIDSREALEEAVATVERAWHGHELVRPENWGGYRLVPDVFEFWQGRQSRLHDRLRFSRAAGGDDGADGGADQGWTRQRLQP